MAALASRSTINYIIAATAVTLLTISVLLGVLAPVRMNACYIRREIQKPPPPLIPLRDGLLHDSSVFVLWMAMFLLALLPNARSTALFSLNYASLWFHCTYIYLAAFKGPLEDFNCVGRHTAFPNGISGHYCYFLFVALSAHRFTKNRLKANPRASNILKAVILVLLALFGVGGTATLYRTFFHGYHSARQVLLGSAMGLLSHVALDIILLQEETGYSIVSRMTFMLANSISSLVFYYRLWPHDSAPPAISQSQLTFHSTLWALLLVSFSFIVKKNQQRLKEA